MLDQIVHSIQQLVVDLGYPGLFLLIVLESTMVPIPSLLVMPFAGFLASKGFFSLPVRPTVTTPELSPIRIEGGSLRPGPSSLLRSAIFS